MYSQHSGKKNIDLDDVKLSVSMNTEQTFTSPPPREALLELARVKNAVQVMSLHYGNQGRDFPHVNYRPFLESMIAPGAFLMGNGVRYLFPTIKIPLNLDIKAQNPHKTAYISSYQDCPPGPSMFPIVHCTFIRSGVMAPV